jgi:glycosyltransferase involved in cell wall biosynthesis
MQEKPYFSIVIPALNEEKYLPKLLRDLSKQTLSDFEVIVVDGHSDDATVQKCQSYSKKIPLSIISTEVRNVSFQRNLGGKKAQGKWLVFMDADNRLPNYYLEGVRYNLSKLPTTDLFTTWLDPDKKGQLEQTIANTSNYWFELAKHIGKPAAYGALVGVKRSVFLSNKFDEEQQVFEDAYFIRTCMEKGHTFEIFQEPRFILSLRRFRKEGTLILLAKFARMQLNYLQNKDFAESNFGYEMRGGKSHDLTNVSAVSRINTFLRTAPKKQLALAKELLNSLRDLQIK